MTSDSAPPVKLLPLNVNRYTAPASVVVPSTPSSPEAPTAIRLASLDSAIAPPKLSFVSISLTATSEVYHLPMTP